MIEYRSIAELVDLAEKDGCRISEIVLADQAEFMEKSVWELQDMMGERLAVMEDSIDKSNRSDLRSTSGLTGGDSYKMLQYYEGNEGLLGGFVDKAVARAIGVAEYNASMGKIVAAPTAGSCGIMPGCLVSMLRDRGYKRENVLMSMFTAAAIGMVINNRASLAGATGGCQAECGSAAAMTAAALTELMGGSPAQCADAAAIALKNQLGLVCDPVAGLVEIPCIKRNAQGVVTAFCAADIAMAGIRSYIPVDEVIAAMKSVGNALPETLKETAGGGLATTTTGLRLKAQVFGTKDNK